MKFTCLQENLNKGLSVVSKAVPIKSSLPILSNVLISTEDGRLKLRATNLDISITVYVGASIEQDGAITIPARLFQEFVSHLSPATLACDLKDASLHVQSSKVKSKFNGTSASDYPDIPEAHGGSLGFEVDSKLFAHAVGSVAFSASADEGRPVLTGILFSVKGGALTLVGVDGYRLSERIIAVSNSSGDFSVVIPAKTLLEISRIFSGSAEPVKIAFDSDDNIVLFGSEDILVSSRIIDGQFPDHKKIIPSGNSLSAEFSAADLLESVKLASVFAKRDDGGVVRMAFDPAGTVRVSSSHEETGENSSEFEAKVDGDPLEIAFNSKYLLDVLGNVKASSFCFETSGGLSACVLKPLDQEGYLHIIMPRRVSN